LAQEFVATDGDVSHIVNGGDEVTSSMPVESVPGGDPMLFGDSAGYGEPGYGPGCESGGYFEGGSDDGACFAGDTPGTEVPQACRDLWDQSNSCRKLWFRAEYLDWSVKGDILPPLLTTSPPGTPQGVAGVLGEDTTQVLFPTGRVNQGARPGMRFQAGWWFDQGETNGIQADYFILQEQSTNFATRSPNTPILARPFFNPVAGVQDASYLAFPDFEVLGVTANLAGSFVLHESSQAQSASLLWRRLLWVNCNRHFWYRLNFTGGYRYFGLDESLRIADQVTPTGGPFANGTQIDSIDEFVTSTTFNGLDIGLNGDIHRGRFSVELLGRIAFGNSHQVQNIAGQRRVFDTVSTVVTEGGLLTQPTNIGRSVHDDFAILPEGGVTLGMQITGGLKVTVGYSFLYLSQVQRPGDSIDFVVNPTQIGGSMLAGDARPLPQFDSTGIWLQGLSVGLDFRY
jgi:hypothetical protein